MAVHPKLIKILIEVADIDKKTISEKTGFLMGRQLDDMESTELLNALEDDFELDEISDKEARTLQTVGDVIAFLKKHRKI